MSGISDSLKDRLAELDPSMGRRRRRARAAPASLGDLLGVSDEDGVLVVERSYSELTSSEAAGRLLRALDRASKSVLARDDVDASVRQLLADPAGALFVDTETTGLSGNMIFLLGAMRFDGSDLRLTQVFARDYGEEPRLLKRWTSMLRDASMLVSFNGKSFDLPMLRDRLAYHRMAGPTEPPHLDLLHHSRRRWGKTLPDCRLQTLEWRLCGRRRAGDIPGDEIPSVYHRYVRTGEAGDILSVFHHNALDIITLAEIALALADPEDGPA